MWKIAIVLFILYEVGKSSSSTAPDARQRAEAQLRARGYTQDAAGNWHAPAVQTGQPGAIDTATSLLNKVSQLGAAAREAYYTIFPDAQPSDDIDASFVNSLPEDVWAQ